jgi:hypothetical protein
MVVVDAKSGKIFGDVPFRTVDTGFNPVSPDHVYSGLKFRADSELLEVEGCFDADARRASREAPDCARKFYQWSAPHFVMVWTIPLKAPDWLRGRRGNAGRTVPFD